MGKGECIKGLRVMGRSQQLGEEHWGRAHTLAPPLPADSRKLVSRFCAWCCTKGKKAHTARVLANKEPWSRSPRLPQQSGNEHHRLNLTTQVHEHMHMSKYFFPSNPPNPSIAVFKDALCHPVCLEIVAFQPEMFGGEIYLRLKKKY